MCALVSLLVGGADAGAVFAAMLLLFSLATGAMAAVQRETLIDGSLNRWDEAAAIFALSLVVRNLPIH